MLEGATFNGSIDMSGKAAGKAEDDGAEPVAADENAARG